MSKQSGLDPEGCTPRLGGNLRVRPYGHESGSFGTSCFNGAQRSTESCPGVL